MNYCLINKILNKFSKRWSDYKECINRINSMNIGIYLQTISLNLVENNWIFGFECFTISREVGVVVRH